MHGTMCLKSSLLSFLNVTDWVSYPHLWKYYINMHHMFIFQLSSYQKTKDTKTLWRCSKDYSKLFSFQFLDPATLIPQCYSQILLVPTLPNFQTMYQVGHVFWRCDIPTVSVEYIIRNEMWSVNVQLQCSNYKWQLHVSATK
jgi:hypothetical protein